MVPEQTILFDKAVGCLEGGQIGDAMGTPTEGKHYSDIEASLGWVAEFEGSGTDDTIMRDLLAEALVATGGFAMLDDWAQVWLDRWEAIFGPKEAKFFISVKHTAQKLRRYSLPRMAALGNMPSSSSAMCIAPVGIVNACNPRQAALQAYNLAALIHTHEVAFCQDGDAAVAAAIAESFKPAASVESVLHAAQAAIMPVSGAEMLDCIEAALDLARRERDYTAFRAATYADPTKYFRSIQCDSRETVPLTLALFLLANGSVAEAVIYSANFGRDADTIGAMAGAMAGALQGAGSIDPAWRQKIAQSADSDPSALASRLIDVAISKRESEETAFRLLDSLREQVPASGTLRGEKP